MWSSVLLLLAANTAAAAAAAAERELWYTRPATHWTSQSLPIGNGRHAASLFGGVVDDVWTLNVDSLWTGGSFQSGDYRGGNPNASLVTQLRKIQDQILRDGTGDVSPLLGSDAHYGSYTVLGNMTVSLDLLVDTTSDYRLSLDLAHGIGASSFATKSHGKISRTYFCSHPDQVCVYHLSASRGVLPAVTISLGNELRDASTNISATGNTITFRGLAEDVSTAMVYDARASVVLPTGGKQKNLATSDGKLYIPASTKSSELWVLFTADTNYNVNAGTAASGYSFRGADPAPKVLGTISAARKRPYKELLSRHVADHSALFGAATITFPDPLGSSKKPTDEVMRAYTLEEGDPFLEGLLFDFGKYLLIGSSRADSLPPGLQGKWANGLANPWSGDYHTDVKNINLQMPIWGAEALGLGDTLGGFWEYMQKTWAPRGGETAKLLYGGEGWVVHNEVNIFGHTGIKGQGFADSATWALYTSANAWMMQHVWDRFSYGRNTTWYQAYGYPLLKSTALFHISTLRPDTYHNDSTLVAVPCNSPEQRPTTFGCSINQQQVFELLNNLLKGWSSTSDSASFKSRVQRTLKSLDSGIRVGRYGQIQEWKLDLDSPTDQHRHLSHLQGWYPGYSIPRSLAAAVETTLQHRGWGQWTDADAGWAKIWRAAAWAGLNNATAAHYALRFAVQRNFAENLWSMYSKDEAARDSWIFQADANWAWKGAVVEMFLRDRDWRFGEEGAREVVVAPAVPKAWWGSRANGLRIRGGGKVSFGIDGRGKVVDFVKSGVGSGVRFVDAAGRRV